MILSDAEWLARLRRLTHQQQSAVITYIDSLPAESEPAADENPLLSLVGLFDPQSLAEMEAAIRDCERIDLDEWR